MSDRYTLVFAIIKGLGLLIAGVFGLIGATTNFKGEDKKLTYWGKWNLAALTFGLLLSMTAQMLEYRKGLNDANSAANKARNAAQQTEEILTRSTEAAERIGDVADKIVRLSAKANESALAISAVQANVERGLDPIEPLRVTYILDFPLKAPDELSLDSATKQSESEADSLWIYSKLYEDLHERAKGRMIPICPDCDDQKSIYKANLARQIVTKKYALLVAFFPKSVPAPTSKFVWPDHGTNMGFIASETPDTGPDPLSVYDDSALGRRPFHGVMSLWFLEHVIPEDHITWPTGTRSLWDLLGKRMIIRVRWELPKMQFEDTDNQLPQEIKRTLGLSMLDLDFSGHRRLKFFPAEKASDLRFVNIGGAGLAQPLHTVHTTTDSFWYYDFPDRMEELRKYLSQ